MLIFLKAVKPQWSVQAHCIMRDTLCGEVGLRKDNGRISGQHEIKNGMGSTLSVLEVLAYLTTDK